MNQYLTAAAIRTLREKNNLTQADLAEKLNVSDKTISKWETGKGYPDISMLEPIAKTFDMSITELISGNIVCNVNISANMLKSKFYVCPVCGNSFHSMGEAVISCHGVQLYPLEAEPAENNHYHKIKVERIEDEYFVSVDHEMTKQHYISFIAALSPDRIQLVKLYPEGNPQVRFQIRGVKKIYAYCNRDGLFVMSGKFHQC